MLVFNCVLIKMTSTANSEMTFGQLVDIALGAPDLTIVNFNFLYALFQSLLKRLGLVETLVNVPPETLDMSNSKAALLVNTKTEFISDADSGVTDMTSHTKRTGKGSANIAGNINVCNLVTGRNR